MRIWIHAEFRKSYHVSYENAGGYFFNLRISLMENSLGSEKASVNFFVSENKFRGLYVLSCIWCIILYLILIIILNIAQAR